MFAGRMFETTALTHLNLGPEVFYLLQLLTVHSVSKGVYHPNLFQVRIIFQGMIIFGREEEKRKKIISRFHKNFFLMMSHHDVFSLNRFWCRKM